MSTKRPLNALCTKFLPGIEATCNHPGCDGNRNCVAGKCDHTMITVHSQWAYNGRILARCEHCSVEASIIIPTHIPDVQRWKYAVHILEKINNGTIEI